jgi:2,3,4,5-tetrahydropyridine-2,6-dicarboxylate N-succinyltransferase
MTYASLISAIDAAWEDRAALTPAAKGPVRDAVETALQLLDRGEVRVAEKRGGEWAANEWLKKALLLYFRLSETRVMTGGPHDFDVGPAGWYDKVPSKFAGWGEDRFRAAGFRAVPGAIVRYSAYIAPDVVLMPSFVNVGARVESGTMVDTWATVASCAQIGRNCHISGGAGIGGVLEPLQATPVVGEGSVLSMGVYLGASTRIVDRATGETFMGRVPPYSVVVSGTMPGKPLPDGSPGPGLYCAVIVKRVDAKTRAKTAINELLRT